MKPTDLLSVSHFVIWNSLNTDDSKNLLYKLQKNFIEFLLLVDSLKVISTYWYFKTIIILSTART